MLADNRRLRSFFFLAEPGGSPVGLSALGVRSHPHAEQGSPWDDHRRVPLGEQALHEVVSVRAGAEGTNLNEPP